MNNNESLKLNNLIYLILIVAFILCYYHTFLWLHHKYSFLDSYYSHGYLIPFVSFYLIYAKRDKIKSIKFSSDIIGLEILVFALLIHIAAVMSDINFISGFSMFFFIIGCSLYLFGRKVAKHLAFPIFFLLFMFPVPNIFINTIGLPTKSFATDIGLMIVNMVDIPYFREGFRINLTGTTLVVGTPCNGMKSLISFAALGLIGVYLSGLSIKKSLIIIAGVYPVAVVLNGCRIAILILIADKYGIEKASPESFLHDLSGVVVFIAGLAVMFLAVKVLESRKRELNN